MRYSEHLKVFSMRVVWIDQGALPHSRELYFAGVGCHLQTSSSELARSLELLSLPANRSCLNRFSMRIAVDATSNERAGSPHFRGLHHVVTASFGSANVFVFDILRCTLSASISNAIALIGAGGSRPARWPSRLRPPFSVPPG